MSRPIVVVGDALLDRDLEGRVERLSPDAPVPIVEDPHARDRPGGAGLAASLLASDGRDVTLVTALGVDHEGSVLRRLLERSGVHVIDVGLEGRTPRKVRVRSDGRSLLRLDYGGAGGRVGPPGDAVDRALGGAAGILVADYGRGMAFEERLRASLASVRRRVPLVWDPHPRGADPVEGARLCTPNRQEARRLTPEIRGDSLTEETARARALLERWRAAAVAITLSERGALLTTGADLPLVVPAPERAAADACGAGDRFAATAAALLADGALPSEAVTEAVRTASAFVAAGGAGAAIAPEEPRERHGARPEEVIRRTRRMGGTVVATSGCFDLVHAGHVAMLRAARALGDCLIVLLNSDDSVRRLKGEGRPFVTASDREAVLSALEFVDAVTVFEEDTPIAALERLRPDVFAKGGDYTIEELPEAPVIAGWGGQAVVLPYMKGRSTTELMQEVIRRDGA